MKYIKQFHPDCKANTINELSDDEFRLYSRLKLREESKKPPVEKKEKKRKDAGKKRESYKCTLPKDYLSYIKRANRKKIAFDISLELFEEMKRGTCIYCGDTATGIDRVDSKKGYTKDNMVSACKKCNLMKFTYNTEDFLSHIQKIIRYTTQQNTKLY
jgi:RNase P subunit RPR2